MAKWLSAFRAEHLLVGVSWRGFLASVSRPGRGWINWRARKCGIPPNAVYDLDRQEERAFSGGDATEWRNVLAWASYAGRRQEYERRNA